VLIDKSPETLCQSQAILDDEVAQVVGKAIAVAREVPSSRRPVAARDVDTITASPISDKETSSIRP
jgi:hypothetical protein